MALPMLVGGADCGPSNPLQNLTKRFDQDRGIQQVCKLAIRSQDVLLTDGGDGTGPLQLCACRFLQGGTAPILIFPTFVSCAVVCSTFVCRRSAPKHSGVAQTKMRRDSSRPTKALYYLSLRLRHRLICRLFTVLCPQYVYKPMHSSSNSSCRARHWHHGQRISCMCRSQCSRLVCRPCPPLQGCSKCAKGLWKCRWVAVTWPKVRIIISANYVLAWAEL